MGGRAQEQGQGGERQDHVSLSHFIIRVAHLGRLVSLASDPAWISWRTARERPMSHSELLGPSGLPPEAVARFER